MASWVKEEIVSGPFDSCPVYATVNSLQTAPKPTGAVRIIVNSSVPRGKSVNDCLKDKNMYPAFMGGIKELLVALNYCGRGAELCKVDWVNAYKHFWVKEKQIKYQWMKFLEKFFVELCLCLIEGRD